MITNVTNMIAYIWFIIRDYHASTYSLKTVCNIAVEQLRKDGYTVETGKQGNLTVNGIPYRIFKTPGWNSYDVRNTGI